MGDKKIIDPGAYFFPFPELSKTIRICNDFIFKRWHVGDAYSNEYDPNKCFPQIINIPNIDEINERSFFGEPQPWIPPAKYTKQG